ncbi:hypothetical protein [Sphingomonas glacialis]|uniref:UrcA family protein n=1 Tax=Sphingomonas glacialis TaxID=658225 RepID=A0A502FB28_9SPHN|nr:hypothetical protein [Sphingomonas glacialis]TPG46524.1 hypothetical protein EAH76_23165 [Sphingomonas glacialis]
MKSKANFLIAIIAAGTSVPIAAADESPKERYEVDRTCAAVSVVAIERNDLPSTIPATDAAPIAALFLKRTQTSGQRVGLDAAAISDDIGAVHQSIIANLTSADTVQATAERSDTARMLKNCAALVGFEVERSVASRQ